MQRGAWARGSRALEGHRLALQLADGDGVCAGCQSCTCRQVAAVVEEEEEEPETEKQRAQRWRHTAKDVKSSRRQQVVHNAASSVTHTNTRRQTAPWNGPVPDIKVKPPGSTTPAGVFSNVPLVVVVVVGCQEAEFVCTCRDSEDVETEEDVGGVLPDRLDPVKAGLTSSCMEGWMEIYI